jgi:hypothetical protein
MRLLLTALILALLAVPAFARGKHQPAQKQQSEDQLKKSKEADKNYKDSLNRIPDQKAADPWGTLR